MKINSVLVYQFRVEEPKLTKDMNREGKDSDCLACNVSLLASLVELQGYRKINAMRKLKLIFFNNVKFVIREMV